MSSNTKQVLAITLGSVGLVIGIFAMVTAYNAKQAADDDSAISTQVDQQFAQAQARQDAREDANASKAEKLIDGLSKNEKGLVKKINGNRVWVKRLRRQNRNQNKKINGLKKRANTLASRGRATENEVSSLENIQQNNFQTMSRRINRLNGEIQVLQMRINRLRNRVAFSN